MVVVVGGTFSILHPGHKKLLKAAVDTGDTVMIGLTTDRYLEENKSYSNVSYAERKRELTNYMDTFHCRYEIKPLDNREGNSSTSPDYTSIVISPETYQRALRINEERKRRGLKPLEIIKVPYVLGNDLFPISSSRIMSGEIDINGNRAGPVRISIATKNDLKVRCVSDYASRVFSKYEIIRSDGPDLPSDQPFGSDTEEWAIRRSRGALGENDYSIGVESGLFYQRASGAYLDVHFCAITDKFNRITIGSSSGFQVPDDIIDSVKLGMNESDAFQRLYGDGNIGQKEGIAGKISGNELKRHDLIMESIRNAFLPRIHPDFY
ncbi:MAG: pantetheine-phosphate adenylyltransferase [Thermoplasmata archaeon]